MRILSLVVTLFISLSASASISSDWYDLEGTQKSLGDEAELQETLDAITKAQSEALEQEGSGDKIFGYKFSGIKTVLALGLSGKIGLKSWGGSKAVELNWARKSSSKSFLSNQEENLISLKGDLSEGDWNNILSEISNNFETEGIIEGSSGFKKHLEKETAVFRELIKGANEVNHRKFKTSKLRLDLNFGFSNSVTGFFIKAGGDLRIRFEWTPVIGKVTNNKALPSKLQKQMKELLEKMGPILIDAMDEEYSSNKSNFHDKYKLKEFKLAVSTSVEGDLGFTQGSQGIAAHVYFKPVAHKKNIESEAGEINFVTEAEDKIWPFKKKKIVKLSKRKIKKGIRKAIRFGHYFGDKVKSNEKSDWGVKVLKTSYAFSLKGKTGVVTIKGEPSVELAYSNTEFDKGIDKGLFKQDWGLSTLRVRTRLKGGIEIPWLAKFELKPFVETIYKK